MALLPRVDLINMDNWEFEGLQFVLTSPRSLEACRRLGIEPVTLLHQPLSTLRELMPELPEAALKVVAERLEVERRSRLKQARLERERVVDEDAAAAVAASLASTGARKFGVEQQLNGTAYTDYRKVIDWNESKKVVSVERDVSCYGKSEAYGENREGQEKTFSKEQDFVDVLVGGKVTSGVNGRTAKEGGSVTGYRHAACKESAVSYQTSSTRGKNTGYYRKVGSTGRKSNGSRTSAKTERDIARESPNQPAFSPLRKAGSVQELSSAYRRTGGGEAGSGRGVWFAAPLRKAGSERQLDWASTATATARASSNQQAARHRSSGVDSRWGGLSSSGAESDSSETRPWSRTSGGSLLQWRPWTRASKWRQGLKPRPAQPLPSKLPTSDYASTSEGEPVREPSFLAGLLKQRQRRAALRDPRRTPPERESASPSVEFGDGLSDNSATESHSPGGMQNLEQMRLERFRAAADRRKLLAAEIDDFRQDLRRLRLMSERRALDAAERSERAQLA